MLFFGSTNNYLLSIVSNVGFTKVTAGDSYYYCVFDAVINDNMNWLWLQIMWNDWKSRLTVSSHAKTGYTQSTYGLIINCWLIGSKKWNSINQCLPNFHNLFGVSFTSVASVWFLQLVWLQPSLIIISSVLHICMW
jgi:hypothetical protein